ncbi:MAG: hypothetical protein Q4E83_01125 [bacterium]|nr:hypothetical protein [bacterium]
MKINSILNHKLSNHKTFTQDKNSGLITQNNNKNKYLAIGCAATVLAGVTGVLVYKKHKSQVLDIGDGELLKLKEMGIKGIEVNHQYTPSKIKKLGEKSGYGVDKADNALKELSEKYKDFAEKNDMFLSGGTDSHEKQIFSREPKISQNLLEEKFLK